MDLSRYIDFDTRDITIGNSGTQISEVDLQQYNRLTNFLNDTSIVREKEVNRVLTFDRGSFLTDYKARLGEVSTVARTMYNSLENRTFNIASLAGQDSTMMFKAGKYYYNEGDSTNGYWLVWKGTVSLKELVKWGKYSSVKMQGNKEQDWADMQALMVAVYTNITQEVADISARYNYNQFFDRWSGSLPNPKLGGGYDLIEGVSYTQNRDRMAKFFTGVDNMLNAYSKMSDLADNRRQRITTQGSFTVGLPTPVGATYYPYELPGGASTPAPAPITTPTAPAMPIAPVDVIPNYGAPSAPISIPPPTWGLPPGPLPPGVFYMQDIKL